MRQDAHMAQLDVPLVLSRDEALVLFDLLHRWEDSDRVDQPQHKGEQIALWNLSALLESALTEPFNRDYSRLVAQARERLCST